MINKHDSGTLEDIKCARWNPSFARPDKRMNPMTAKLFLTSIHLQPISLKKFQDKMKQTFKSVPDFQMFISPMRILIMEDLRDHLLLMHAAGIHPVTLYCITARFAGQISTDKRIRRAYYVHLASFIDCRYTKENSESGLCMFLQKTGSRELLRTVI